MNHTNLLWIALGILATMTIGGYLWDHWDDKREDIDAGEKNKRFDDL